jgi:dihydroorotate dehydrogenase (NAD+) catalytic subunit
MTASGTSGHGAELEAYFPLSRLGAVVVKSLAAEPWAGNPPPRLHEAGDAMLNSVGLQGPGVDAWRANDLPQLERANALTVVSIWGRTVEEYEKAAVALGGASVAAIADAIAAVVRVAEQPVWAKLTAHVTNLVDIAAAAHEAGASAVTLTNTMLGLAIDVETRRAVLGGPGGGGGLSGAAIHPIAVRAVHDVHAARPSLPIVGVGGVRSGIDAIELLLAGASAVQVGTATFADPRAPLRVLEELEAWCASRQVSVRDIIGGMHG